MENIIHAVQSFAQRHWRHVMVILLVVIAGLVVYQRWRSKTDAELAKTWHTLNEMPPVQSLRYRRNGQKKLNNVISQCKSMLTERWTTSATPWMLLKLANAQTQAGRLRAADKTLKTLHTDFPEHYATQMSQAIRGGVKEEIKEYKQAARTYADLARRQKGDSSRWVDAGRAWELAGKKKRALSAYQKAMERSDSPSSLARFRHTVISRTGELLPALPPRPQKKDKSEDGKSPLRLKREAPSPTKETNGVKSPTSPNVEANQ
jgi:predicted negative regulator of RcsB-dependent stress response